MCILLCTVKAIYILAAPKIMATTLWPKIWHHRKWRIYVWKHMASTCKCYHQMRVVYIWEWTTFCAQTSLCWWLYTGLVVHKAEQHAYKQTAVLWAKLHWSAMLSYIKHWVIVPCCIKQLQGGCRHSKCQRELVTCNTVHVPCLFTQTCQWP